MKKRNLYLIGKVESGPAREIVQQIMDSPRTEFRLFISSEGGVVYDGLALVNAIENHGRVDTICLGAAFSSAADILASGRKRYIVPNAVAMLHQVGWEMEWQYASVLARNARFLERLNDQMAEHLAARIGKSKQRLLADSKEDFYLYGKQIIDYGLADEFWPARGPGRRSSK